MDYLKYLFIGVLVNCTNVSGIRNRTVNHKQAKTTARLIAIV